MLVVSGCQQVGAGLSDGAIDSFMFTMCFPAPSLKHNRMVFLVKLNLNKIILNLSKIINLDHIINDDLNVYVP